MLAIHAQIPSGRLAGHGPFILLSLVLCAAFFAGGSSWPTEPGLRVLRPLTLGSAALGLWSLRPDHVGKFAGVWITFASVAALTAAHLVPLPFDWWSQLPGRQIIVDIDAAAGLGHIARPLSLAPDDTANALWSLSVPFAVLVLAAQLNVAGQRRILILTTALAALSGLTGLLQASGADIQFYALASDTAGVFANRNHQSALLAMIFPMTAAIATTSAMAVPVRKLKILVAAALAVIALPLVVVTGSRSGLVLAAFALVSSLVALALPALINQRAGSRPARLGAIAVAGALTLVMVGATVLASRDVAIDRLGSAGQDLRWPLWQSVIAMIPHYLPWGTGIGTFGDAFRILEPDSLLHSVYFNHAHNEWLEIALTAGVPGLAIAVGSALLVIWGSVRAFRASGSNAIFARLGLIMILVLAAASVTDYPVRTPLLMTLLALASIWASAARGFIEPQAERT